MVFRYYDGRPLRQLRDEVDQLVTGFLAPMAESYLPPGLRCQPAVDVWEQDEAVMVELEVPGIKSDQIDISVAGNELSIKVNQPDMAREGAAYHRRERPVGTFSRLLRLPTEVAADRVGAELRDGVLTITLPKSERAKVRKITVAGS